MMKENQYIQEITMISEDRMILNKYKSATEMKSALEEELHARYRDRNCVVITPDKERERDLLEKIAILQYILDK